jgi:hypothetical protein
MMGHPEMVSTPRMKLCVAVELPEDKGFKIVYPDKVSQHASNLAEARLLCIGYWAIFPSDERLHRAVAEERF